MWASVFCQLGFVGFFSMVDAVSFEAAKWRWVHGSDGRLMMRIRFRAIGYWA